jgi:enoyl-CoA hydratase/carnithine racemase
VSEATGRVEAELEGGVLTLRLAHPERANALDEPMLAALIGHLARAEERGARVVLLGGAGERHFSAGLDLAARGPEGVRAGERALGEATRAVRACPCPVVAVLTGHAFGGALELAMTCDWRIARRGARFGMTPARLGVVYAREGLRAFVEAIGPAHTRELFATAEPVEAERALAIGMVSHVVEPDELWPLARAAAERIAANAPIAVAGATAILRDLDDAALAEAWRERAWASEDLAEGLSAFRDRRPPRFSGR